MTFCISYSCVLKIWYVSLEYVFNVFLDIAGHSIPFLKYQTHFRLIGVVRVPLCCVSFVFLCKYVLV